MNWSVVPGVRYYRLYSIAAGGTPTPIGESRGATADWWVFPIKAYGEPLHFAIEAVSESGVVSRRVTSNEVVPERTTLGPAPPAPGSARAVASSNGTVTVTWDVVAGATGYTISRMAIPGGNRVVCRLCAPTGSFVDTDAVSGSKHTYRVVAITPKGTSRGVVSNEVTPLGGTATVAATVPTVARGTLHLTPSPGSCLSLGQEGNFVVRLADGSVRQYQRVTFDNGMRLVPNPTLEVVPGISDAVAVSTSAHSLALRSDGTILAWGPNGHGELGSEQAIDRRFGGALPRFSRLPVPVREIGNAVAVAAGSEHSVALLADGTIRTWGSGEYGIPGNGVLEARMGYNHFAPAKVIGIESAVKISTGGNYIFALLKDGSIRAWGNNNLPLGAKGVLGTADNQTTAVPTPVQDVSNAVDVVATGGGGAALLADGTLRAWGGGYGPGHRPQDQATNKPVTVDGIRGAIAISPEMVLMPDGSVRDFPSQPSWTTPKLTNAVAIASGGPNRFAVLADGRLVAWGHKRWYPNGMVTVATLGPDTAHQCAAKPR